MATYSKMTTKTYRNRLNGTINSGQRIDFCEKMLEKSKNWPEDTILDVTKSLRAKVSKDEGYTSRVPFGEAVVMSTDHHKRIRDAYTAGTNGIHKVDGLGWIIVSANTANVKHSYETLKWDFTYGISNIKKGEKVYIIPKKESGSDFAIMATTENDAFPLSKSTQDLNWK
tara:strand:+ start:93 stop:602 length:510 start_codon:yes stop_codon:yes gene_type:complete